MKPLRSCPAALLALAACLCLLSACGGDDSPAPSDSADVTQNAVATSSAGEDAQEESPQPSPEQTGPYDASVAMDVTNVDFTALSALSNESIPYGFSNANRDELNRPDGIYYYDNLYGQYNGYTHIDTEEKIIYLTMDEGYENGYTPAILDTLQEKGVSAVFFITKQFYDDQPALVQRMIDEGHIVGNHTCSHPSGGMPQLGLQAEYEDIKTLNDLVYDSFGYQMKLFRFPEGVASEQSVALVDAMGYKSVFWSFAYYDYDMENQMEPDQALSACLERLHPGAIYLLHAVSATNAEILGDFIDGARAQGYEFGVFPVEDEDADQ